MRGSIVRLRSTLGGLAMVAALLAACDSGSGPDPDLDDDIGNGGAGPVGLSVLGDGRVAERYTSELWVHGGYAYTGTWGVRDGQPGNVLNVWNVQRPDRLDLVRSVPVSTPDSVRTLGDVQVSEDGKILIVATEPFGSLRVFSLTDPADPRPLSSFTSANTRNGVHTAELAEVNGKLYAFLSIDPFPPRLVVVDLSDPANPKEVLARVMGEPFLHDVFVRDGILFTALWNGGLTTWDIGGGGKGGSVANPVEIGNVKTVDGHVHNVWWYHGANKKYVFVGEESPSSAIFGAGSAGDIHVVDISNLAKPEEVAFYNVPGAGTHNFSMDEQRGLLFAAYYNGGVRALDVRGDLGSCTAAQRSPDGRCNLGLMQREVANALTAGGAYVWGVQYVDGGLFASDMLNGLYRLDLEGLAR